MWSEGRSAAALSPTANLPEGTFVPIAATVPATEVPRILGGRRKGKRKDEREGGMGKGRLRGETSRDVSAEWDVSMRIWSGRTTGLGWSVTRFHERTRFHSLSSPSPPSTATSALIVPEDEGAASENWKTGGVFSIKVASATARAKKIKVTVSMPARMETVVKSSAAGRGEERRAVTERRGRGKWGGRAEEGGRREGGLRGRMIKKVFLASVWQAVSVLSVFFVERVDEASRCRRD